MGARALTVTNLLTWGPDPESKKPQEQDQAVWAGAQDKITLKHKLQANRHHIIRLSPAGEYLFLVLPWEGESTGRPFYIQCLNRLYPRHFTFST